MIISDPVYGPTSVEEPVIEALLQSPSLCRLQDVDMAGYARKFWPGCEHTRFEHSVGVSLLLRRFGARLEEQVHGLLHDVSHTVFSHAADYAGLGGSEAEHSYQDNLFRAYVLDTEIPEILQRFGLNVNYVLDEQNFPMQERDLPDLCADRIDYAVRSAKYYLKVPVIELCAYLDQLEVIDNVWCFRDFESAYGFAKLFSRLDDEIWDSFQSGIMLRTLGSSLDYSLQGGILTRADLFTTDSYVLAKMHAAAADDVSLRKLLRRMNLEVGCINDPQIYEAEVTCKSRIVDPFFITTGGTPKRVSEHRSEWQAVVENGLRPKRYHLRFVED